MNYQRYVKAIVYATVVLWTILLLLDHQAIHSEWLKPVSTVVTLVLWLVIAFDLWLWKWPLLQGWFVKRPVIDGTWLVEIRSNWRGADVENTERIISAYMVIRQTLSTLSMRLLTAESTSVLVGTEIVCSPDGLYCISGVYRNEPSFDFRHRSEIHYGGVWLQIAEDQNVKTIDGHYWTDRNTAGSIRLLQRHTTKTQSFHAAATLFGNTGTARSAP